MRKTRLISICVFSLFLLDFAAMLSPGTDRIASASESTQAQDERVIRGVILDANGEPVIGASVIQSGTSNGVVTSVDGTFSIKVTQGAKMDVSCLGYNDLSFTVDQRVFRVP